MKRIIQLLPNLAYGDAVGNDVLALNKLLNSLNIETKIYAIKIGNRIPVGIAESFYDMPVPEKDDIIVYHLSIGCKIIRDYLLHHDCRKVMIYHNITPAHFFLPYSDKFDKAIREGLEDLQLLKDTFEVCITVSEFNKQDLRARGYTCPIAVLPILVPFADYDRNPDYATIFRYAYDGWKNILFVGRIAPNKCQEDVILAFAAYKKLYNANARLLIVGNPNNTEIYYNRLKRYVKELGVTDVIFTGFIPFEQILAYYHLADAFLCMSEHEGFCVPLLEAMKFDIPIVAYSSTAIPYTMGNAGIVFPEKDPNMIAAILDEVIGNKELRERLITGQRQRLEYFRYENVERLAEQIFQQIINRKNIETDESDNKDYKSNFNLLLPKLEEKIKSRKIEKTKPFSEIPIKSGQPTFVQKYYKSMNSQGGIVAYIKKRLFGNLLGVLVAQEKFIAKQEKRLASQEKRLVSQERRLAGQEKRLAFWEEPVLRKQPGLLIDVTCTAEHDSGTGIQRVVNRIFSEIYRNKGGKEVFAVRNYYGKFITGTRYINRFFGEESKQNYILTLQPGDKLLLLDSSWGYAEDFVHNLDSAQNQNIPSFAVVYDLIPFQYPELTSSPQLVKAFGFWHYMILCKADSILCISQSVADVVAQYYKTMKFKRNRPLNLYYFHMGADIPSGAQEAREEIQEFVKMGSIFLMVGTLEPRKGHMVALQAFSKILKETRQDCRLLIIGHNGWKNDEIRITLDLPEYKDHILWIQDASDEELRWAYAHADALIAASRDEGYGLPLVEAAYFGLPIICSDIPIFREVTQGNADYFKVMDAEALAACLIQWLQASRHPDSRKIRLYTWEESASEVMDIIDRKVKPYKVLY